MDVIKWFYQDKDDDNDDLILVMVFIPKRLLYSKKGFDGWKYKKNVTLRSYLCWKNHVTS